MVVFVAGAHGVGKTFMGRPAAESLGLRYATASSLIRDWLGNRSNWQDNKRTKDIDSNQEALVASVSGLTKNKDIILVLDGHFVLKDETGDLVSLPPDIFRRMGLASVILIEAPAYVVEKRLLERGISEKLEDISRLAEAELSNAIRVCEEIGVPLIRLTSPSKEEFVEVLKKLLEH